MAPEDKIGMVTVERFVEHDQGALVAYGSFGPFFQAWNEHALRWEVPTDGLTSVMMHQGLAATTLHLSCRPVDEVLGLTINIKDPAINLFFTGDASQASVTGRAFLESVQAAESSRLFVQTAHRKGTHESALDVTGLDVLGIYEQYYARSIQTPCKFYELPDNHTYCMIQGLPELNRDWYQELNRDAAAALVEAPYRLLDRREFRFFCGCSPEKLMEALVGMFRDKPQELFQGDAGVEAHCPRCGTRWWIERQAFDKALEG